MNMINFLQPKFKMDLLNLPLNEAERTDQGTLLISLKEFEFGMFNELELFGRNDGYMMRFKSLIELINRELIDFVAYCTTLFGPDIAGRGMITQADFTTLEAHAFSRIWNALYIHSIIDDITEDYIVVIDITIKNTL